MPQGMCGGLKKMVRSWFSSSTDVESGNQTQVPGRSGRAFPAKPSHSSILVSLVQQFGCSCLCPQNDSAEIKWYLLQHPQQPTLWSALSMSMIIYGMSRKVLKF